MIPSVLCPSVTESGGYGDLARSSGDMRVMIIISQTAPQDLFPLLIF